MIWEAASPTPSRRYSYSKNRFGNTNEIPDVTDGQVGPPSTLIAHSPPAHTREGTGGFGVKDETNMSAARSVINPSPWGLLYLPC